MEDITDAAVSEMVKMLQSNPSVAFDRIQYLLHFKKRRRDHTAASIISLLETLNEKEISIREFGFCGHFSKEEMSTVEKLLSANYTLEEVTFKSTPKFTSITNRNAYFRAQKRFVDTKPISQ